MSTTLLQAVLAQIAPQILEHTAASISCFRTYIIPIPETESDQLKFYLKNLPNENPTWQFWEERPGLLQKSISGIKQ
ncbi:MAG: hypothetical protein M3Q44_04960 [bacterium]|nr:hypothetical protein [bacterium]